jgi:hypothetical protein
VLSIKKSIVLIFPLTEWRLRLIVHDKDFLLQRLLDYAEKRQAFQEIFSFGR